ncbi:hypothetical protein JMJ77_0011768 [Colletotrichum scovillei]|uniref:Uncharacterized protein n=1 Tax=Colletotrichum scovillei TaxID=1209932 RepID=A0A9P7U864_9PEZI|nr:hypothetical protein JMJ77_0011768 [Colletotrichum scovillei]KAG7046050.1 hypothetical protein JMJ78_0011119 [Colletotrichum scovillei]KAG7063397.1 hypothetical protein JMJ76_0005863 [Colletotrichum scovillei]
MLDASGPRRGRDPLAYVTLIGWRRRLLRSGVDKQGTLGADPQRH